MEFSIVKILLTFKTVYMHMEKNFTEDQLTELQTGKDIATFFEKRNFYSKRRKEMCFKKPSKLLEEIILL